MTQGGGWGRGGTPPATVPRLLNRTIRITHIQGRAPMLDRNPLAGPKLSRKDTDQPYPGTDEEMSPQADHGETSYTGSGKLEGLVAVITGGDSGIGRAVAIAFAREGADVAIGYLSDKE